MSKLVENSDTIKLSRASILLCQAINGLDIKRQQWLLNFLREINKSRQEPTGSLFVQIVREISKINEDIQYIMLATIQDKKISIMPLADGRLKCIIDDVT